MKTKLFLLLVFTFLFTEFVKSQNQPPKAPSRPVTEIFFGKTITDTYRNLEDLKDPEVNRWYKAQAEYARAVLNRIPGRQSLVDRMKDFDSRRTANIYYVTITDNDRYFYLKTTPEDEIAKLYYRDGYQGTETLLFNPKTFKQEEDQEYSISEYSPSLDGTKTVIEVSPSGSENGVLIIMNVDTKAIYPEQIDRCWGAYPSWMPDGNTFLYNRLNSDDMHDPERLIDSKSYLHKVGADPEEDLEVLSREKYPDLGILPEEFPYVIFDKASQFLFGFLNTVPYRIKVVYAPASELNKANISWRQLFHEEDEVTHFITSDKDMYMVSYKDAPNYKILKTSLQNLEVANAEVVVPETEEALSPSSLWLTSEGLYFSTTKNGVEAKVYHQPFGKKKQEIKLPFTAGSVQVTAKGYKYPEVWVLAKGWTTDEQRFRYLPETNTFQSEPLSAPAQFPEFDDLVIEEIMIPSHDGVNVPLSIIYKRGLKKDGNAPTMIRGYGAYGMSMNPFFNPGTLLWAQEGGVVVIAHVRGGGELGNSWHMAGFKTTKPNTWKDLIACAEYLIKERYTSAKKIAIRGGSAGGLLVGRAMTERPDLFAVAIPEVGLMNTLRMENSSNGPGNTPEFGTVKDSAECMALIEMDAYLHIKEGVPYPATLITAGINDPRVIVSQPGKFAAMLQAASASDKPILFLIDYESGHGMGNSKTKNFELLADAYSFALWQTGHPKYQIAQDLVQSGRERSGK